MKKASTVILSFFIFFGFSFDANAQETNPNDSTTAERETLRTVWVYFTDKGPQSVLNSYTPEDILSERSLKRRAKNNIQVSFSDYPVYPTYIERVKKIVEDVRFPSKWFNALSIRVTQAQMDSLKKLDFVEKLGAVRFYSERSTVYELDEKLQNHARSDFNESDLPYGFSAKQLKQITIPALHNKGLYGQNVMIGMFDSGFRNLNHPAFDSLQIVAQYDFVDGNGHVDPKPNDSSYGSHGTSTLSTIAGFRKDTLIGPAFGAEFVLARTEDTSSETPIEEDNWIRAIEWADSIGIDIASTSLGYYDYDSPFGEYDANELDGNTAMITKAADIAASKGIIVVVSAGNNGDVARDSLGRRVDPHDNTLGAPADGDSVVAVGGINVQDTRVYFSSVGPTADGRIKPDVVALARRVVAARPGGRFGGVSGTSFSAPLTSGAIALVINACPDATSFEVIQAIKETASQANNPDNELGWGIVNTAEAVKLLCRPGL